MNYKNSSVFTSAFTILVTTLTPVIATAAPSTDNVGIKIPTFKASKAANYWTEQKMQEAKPLNIIHTGTPKAVTQVSELSSPTVSAPSSDPSSDLQTLSEPLSSIVQLIAPTPLGFPFRSFFVKLSRYTRYPEKTVGKLFFTQNGGGFVCSASAVNSSNKRLIWTAGHCVSDGRGNFSTNVVFVPAYKPGTSVPEPYGKWSACGIYTTTAWHNSEVFAQDLAAIQACDKSGKRLHNVVGSLGFRANAQRNQFFHAFGYPAAPPFNGTRMVACAAPFAVNDSAQGSPPTIGIGCDMTGGSSGGPWMVKYRPNAGGSANQINGLTSYGYNNQPNVLYSPYFGNTFLSLRNFAIGDGS